MATTECIYSGGGKQDWITPTISSGTINCAWDFDADTVFMLLTLTDVGKWIALIDTATQSMWFASEANNAIWKPLASLSGLTVTNRSLTYMNGTVTSASVLPVPSKPTGYFS